MIFWRAFFTSFLPLFAVAVAAAAFAFSPQSRAEITLRGTGASFPYPIYTQWFRDFSDLHENVFISYEMTGSGAGIRDFIGETIDFAASDAAMDKAEISLVKRGAVLLPMTAGEVVLVYNLPGVDTLKLSREVYADIFRGKISHWDHRKIAAANPTAQLPDLDITVVRRSDASGTSYIFTGHLSSISTDFRKKVGQGRTPNWPSPDNFRKAPGNQGVAALVKQTPGAIGYVEYGFAKLVELPVAELQNRAGNFVAPGAESGSAALENVEFPDGKLPGSGAPNLVAWEWDPEGENAYPITSFTWLLLYAEQDDKKAAALRQLVSYMLSDEAQDQAEDLGYIPLPEEVREKVREASRFIR
ncbi:phosphate ABC transporter substrate-binding protein PstS [Microbulbifer taiwanensis]|uniref:Phosphate-binding protein PstS n=1 Tax=Microbulbifer taiwanensis TaxID=986746 RepID=A0ABW1YKS1_9GAMM|nr:phosphate ABC transporter substrate-binding protein PstS [Microbulbifer taiwanensis]